MEDSPPLRFYRAPVDERPFKRRVGVFRRLLPFFRVPDISRPSKVFSGVSSYAITRRAHWCVRSEQVLFSSSSHPRPLFFLELRFPRNEGFFLSSPALRRYSFPPSSCMINFETAPCRRASQENFLKNFPAPPLKVLIVHPPLFPG